MHAPDIDTALTALSIAFAVWAWVVAWGVSVVRKEVSEMKHTAQAATHAWTEHVTQTERRLTMLETEFHWVKSLVSSMKNGDS